MGNGAIAFLAGLGTGYMSQSQKEKELERQAKLDAQATELHDAKMAELNQAKADRDAMRKAGAAGVVSDQDSSLTTDNTGPKDYRSMGADAPSVIGSDVRQFNRMQDSDPNMAQNGIAPVSTPTAPSPDGQAALQQPFTPIVGKSAAMNGTFYDSKDAAMAAAKAYDTPQARSSRIISALSGIDPVKALDLAHSQEQQKREGILFDNSQSDRTLKLSDEATARAIRAREEGLKETAEAALSGNPQSVFDAFNKNGSMKLKAVPTAKQVTINVPGIGKVPTTQYSGVIVAPDGTETPFVKTAHDMNMARISYDKMLEVGIKGTEADSKGELRVAQAERAAALGEAAAARRAVPKELKPETVQELNDIAQQIDDADPKDRAALQAKYDRRYALAATEIGKVITPKSAQKTDVPKVNADGTVSLGSELFRVDPATNKLVKMDFPGDSDTDRRLAARDAGKKKVAETSGTKTPKTEKVVPAPPPPASNSPDYKAWWDTYGEQYNQEQRIKQSIAQQGTGLTQYAKNK